MFELLATASSGLFAGAAIDLSVVQQPAVRSLDDPTAARFFAPMDHRAAPMQAGLALLGSISGGVAWWTGEGVSWLFGALLFGSVVPFTLLVIKPVNDRLLDPDFDPACAAAPGWFDQWARLHAVRAARAHWRS